MTAQAGLIYALGELKHAGTLESLHETFADGGADARHIATALRDACLARLLVDHRAHLLARYCSDWPDRLALAQRWLARIPRENRQWRAWQLAEYVEDLLEHSNAGERLLEALGERREIAAFKMPLKE